MRWEFHPEALHEFQQSVHYYAERDPQLARRFVEAIEDAIKRILDAPLAWRLLEDDVRRCLTRVFPYGVLCVVEADAIIILAVMHGSREPGYWKSRIEGA